MAAPRSALLARAEGLGNGGHLDAIESCSPALPMLLGLRQFPPAHGGCPGEQNDGSWQETSHGCDGSDPPGLCLPRLNTHRSHGSARRWGAEGLTAVGAALTAAFSPLQNEMLNRQIQKEIWRIQDVMEGLRKNNPSRGTDTAKHRGEQGPSLPLHSTNPGVPRLGASPAPVLPQRRWQHPLREMEAPVHALISAFLHSGHWPIGDVQLQQPRQPPELGQPHQPPQPLLPRLRLPGFTHQARTRRGE